MLKTKLTIVILNFNTKELILDCLASIKNSVHLDYFIKVIVVDNASSDGSITELEKIPWITLVKSPRNIGFSAGNNLAVPFLEGTYTWFLNPDTVVEPDTISKLISYMDEHKTAGVATPRILLPGGKLDKNCHRGLPTPWNSLCHFIGLDRLFPRSRVTAGYYLGHLPEDKTTEVDVVMGSSLLTRTKIGQKIGWWDESYFMYGEDIDFSLKVKRLKYKVMYVPTAIIHHYHGASSGLKKTSLHITKADKSTKLRSVKAGTEAMKKFYLKYYQGNYHPLVTKIIVATISIIGTIRFAKIKALG